MNFNNLSRHVRLIIRGEMLMVQAKLSFAMRRTSVVALALLFAAISLVFINIALFAWLSPLWGPVWTPLGLGLINIALAGIALAIAMALRPGPEMALAQEVRALAGEQLEAEIRTAPLMGGLGLESSAMGLLVPAFTSIIGALSRRRKHEEKA